MTYGLGVDLGTTWTAAAVRRGDAVRVLRLGGRRPEIPSLIFLPADGPVVVGEPALRRGEQQPDRLAREFKRRIGDPVPMLVGGSPYPAHALVARQLEHVLTVATTTEQGPPESVVLTCPANWGPFKRDLLEQAARLADAPRVVLRSEPEAAAISYAAGEHMTTGDVVAVYDLGGGTFDAAVLHRTATGFELLGTPEGIEQLGGVDFDEAVFDHVTQSLPADRLTGDDPDLITALTRLRRDCVDAKEALSFDTEVMIPVALPGLHTRIRLTRGEFEAMIAPAVHETVRALSRALRSAGVPPDRLRAILLAGGSSRIPLAGALVGTEFGRPVVVDPNPEHSIALGAARLTGIIPAPSAASPPPSALPVPVMPTFAPPEPPAAVPPAAPTPSSAVRSASAPISAAPISAAPISAAPISAAPISAAPISTAPTPVPPISAAPTSATPISATPTGPPPAGASSAGEPPDALSPTEPLAVGRAGPVPGDPAGPRRNRTRLLVAAAAVLVVAVAVPITVRLVRAGNHPAAQPSATATAVATTAASVTPAACGFSDDFGGGAVDSVWERNRPDLPVTVVGGAAQLDAPDGADIYNGNMSAPMLLRPITGDFVLEAEVEAAPSIFYQGAGLLLWNGPASYVRMERGFGTFGTVGFEYRNGGPHVWVRGTKPGNRPIRTAANRVVLRMTREGGRISGSWRPVGGGSEFAAMATVQLSLPATVRVGVAALNRAQDGSKPTPFRPRFDRITVTC